MVITAKTSFLIWLVAVVVAAAVPVTCAVYESRPHPREPVQCHDETEIRTRQQDAFRCDPGARLEVYPITVETMLVKCVCPDPCDCVDDDELDAGIAEAGGER